ncbi:MAG: MBL fold metallo-hydrolase [Sphingomonadales bacterium]|jgi:glyoxylase-like metal-dependent hydrolase (beta-lactamase superfamily II)
MRLPLACLLLALAAPATAAGPRFLPWINGTSSEPEMQVQRIDADSFVIRQSVHTNFEAPFLYLLFGRDRALLLDTGAGGLAIRPTVDALIAGWLASHHRSSIPLTVAHFHSHGDHHQDDAEFAGRPDTSVIGLKPADVANAFGITRWPDEIGSFDLGGRPLSIIPTPGHEPAHIMVYDPRTRLLLSGDMLYAGRLYVPTDQFATFLASADRLVAFAKSHRIDAVLGTHIEMTTTKAKDYGFEAPTHPDEHPLALPPDAITRLAVAAHAVAADPKISNQGDFILYPRKPQP